MVIRSLSFAMGPNSSMIGFGLFGGNPLILISS